MTVALQRRARGKQAYLSGSVAEDRVVAQYAVLGVPVVARRWRGAGAEVDLILRDGETLVFTEVKAARTHDQAIARLQQAQMRRIYNAAELYLANEPLGQLTEVRFDVALYDRHGTVQIVENAFGHF
ncbi:YraN family protein [Thalassobius sp. S69A]|uniref:YraN family protein n=1 Tax=unclassified Thalassovita TaxID=2619711 RepID=UPI000C0D686F|nr:hypothetical protein [Paracoccaceae bacterium]MBT25001.1 hypothetical protein [Paracoccaceae bacterium]|tara:strand:- start:341 stop:721 length:381 start_codon:yes stop_codon:yes gene_type:complete